MTGSLRTIALLTALLPAGMATGQPVSEGSSKAMVIATYRVTFQSSWSAATHPQSFPANPHFSGLVGATHDAGVSFWEVGGPASEGIERMAETGSKSQLTAEVNEAISGGRAEFALSGGGIAVSPGQVVMEFDVSSDYPLVTLVSMLAPSPDWFVGVSGLHLRQSGDWVSRIEVPLVVYDAGSDSGDSYTSPNEDTDPPEDVTELVEPPFDVESRVGTFVFERVNVVGVEDETAPAPFGGVRVYPNPSTGLVFVEFEGIQRVEHGVRVFDVLGRVVESKYRVGGGVVGIDLRGRPRGLYVVSVSDGVRSATVPVVVAR